MTSNNKFKTDTERLEHFNKNLLGENGELNLTAIREGAEREQEEQQRQSEKRFQDIDKQHRQEQEEVGKLLNTYSKRKQEERERKAKKEKKDKIESLEKEIERSNDLEMDEDKQRNKRLLNLLDNAIKKG